VTVSGVHSVGYRSSGRTEILPPPNVVREMPNAPLSVKAKVGVCIYLIKVRSHNL